MTPAAFTFRSACFVGMVALLIVNGMPSALGLEPATRPSTQLGVPSEPPIEQVNDAFGLVAGELVSIEVNESAGQALTVVVPVAGREYTLELASHSVRAPGFTVQAQMADGSYVDVDPGPVRTLRGTVREAEGSVAAGSLLDNGLLARIDFADGQTYWIEPIGTRIPSVEPGLHVVYRSEDVRPAAGACGVNAAGEAQAMRLPKGGPTGESGSGLWVAELGCDADYEYFLHRGSVEATVAQIERIINAVNIQYERDVQITHFITAIIVRTSEPDPYSSNDPNVLMQQFRNEWLTNQAHIQRDLAYLFTGKNLNGGIFAMAFIAGVCDTEKGYLLVTDECCGSFACTTDLTAHELGHCWNAQHCSCPTYTMNASLSCANRFHPVFTIPVIIAFRNTLTCLDLVGPLSPPFFEDFPTGQFSPFHWTERVEVVLSSDALNEPSEPYSLQFNENDSVTSNVIATSAANGVDFSFYTEERFAEEGDFFVAEYLDSTLTWQTVFEEEGNAHGNQEEFDFHSFSLPASARHSEFRIRFRVIGLSSADFWYVDDVGVSDDTTPPEIVQGAPGVSFGEHAWSGYIDPRAESDDGVNLNMGLSEITIVFSEPVRDVGGAELTVASFTVGETGGGTPPTLTCITTTDGQTVTLHLNRIITVQQWTGIAADVEDQAGNVGGGQIDVGFLPGDIDQSSTVLPLDNTRFRQMFVGAFSNPLGVDEDYADISRDGNLLPFDITWWRMLLTGQGFATHNWQFTSLPPRP